MPSVASMNPTVAQAGRKAPYLTGVQLLGAFNSPLARAVFSPEQRKALRTRAMSAEPKYNSWTRSGLIERIQALEAELTSRSSLPQSTDVASSNAIGAVTTSTGQKSTSRKAKTKRTIDPSKYATRFIALKLAYLGKDYGGYEFQAEGNSDTIEEHLWKALTKAHLIFPKDDHVIDWNCCEYSKCGRTDKGVSAFGQVIGIRVKSNRPAARKRVKLEDGTEEWRQQDGDEVMEDADADGFDPVKDELPYAKILNRLLPPEIRILAWCPTPPAGFSARHSCRERQYRYFFTQPAFSPELPLSSRAGSASTVHPGWLDIEAMREAAKLFEGEHDFRNFCKIDPGKMMTNWDRTMFEVSITEVKDVSSALPYLAHHRPWPAAEDPSSGVYPKVYSFNVKGSAFLWHQIRHMIGVLFLVGQGYEKPSVVSEMLNVEKNPCKPNFTMADEVPLVLWDCLFPKNLDRNNKEEALEWIHAEDDAAVGHGGLVDSVWKVWREKKMDELLANQLLQEVAEQKRRMVTSGTATPQKGGKVSERVYEGGANARPGGTYVPLLKRRTLEEPETQIEKFAKKKGYEGANDMRKKKGYRTAADFAE